jgi:hypothetical protein
MNQALATVQYKPTDLDTNTLGSVLVKSGFFQDTKDVAQAIVKVLAGRELGFGPIASMQGVYIVKGRVTLSANLVGAAIQRSGKYRYVVKTLTNDACTLVFRGPDNTSFESTFTIQDAQQAGLASGNYKTFPRNMLFARALTNGARWFCPEVFNGPIYTPDELGAVVNDEGQVIEVTASEPAPQPAAVDQETGEMPDDERSAALRDWVVASDEAIRLGIAHNQPPSNASLESIRKGTDGLTARILRKQGAAV